MKATPLVHIGYHKTGSTWFQKELYPHCSSHRYVPRRRVQEALLMDTAFGFNAGRARRLLEDGFDGRQLLLCEEELSGNPHSAGMRGSFSKDLAERIHSTLPDAHVLIFIRNQVDMAAALYRHYVREGGTHGPSRYLRPDSWRTDAHRHPFKFPLFSLEFLQYQGLIAYYRSLFGEGRVHVFAFEAFRQDAKGFVAAFANRLAIQADLAQLDYRPSNAGLSRNALVIARFLNRFTYRSLIDKQWIGPLISNKLRSNLPLWLNRSPLRGPRTGPQEVLGPSLAAEIDWRFADSNTELVQLTGLPLAELGYPTAAR